MKKTFLVLMALLCCFLPTTSLWAFVPQGKEPVVAPATPSWTLPAVPSLGGGSPTPTPAPPAGGVNTPKTGGDLAWLIVAGLVLAAGAALVHRGTLRWGFPVIAGGLALLMWRLGWGALHFHWSPFDGDWWWWVVLGGAWTLSKLTSFTQIDDHIVSLGSAGGLILSFVGSGLLGAYSPGDPQWWVLEVVWVFLIAQAIWTSDYLRARRGPQFLFLAVGWYLLGTIC